MKSSFDKLKSTFNKVGKWFSLLSLRKKIIAIIAIIVVLTVLNRTIFAKKESDYVTGKASRAAIVQTVSETGNVTSSGATDVLSPSSGIVEEIYVENGQLVSTGDILFKVQSTATEQEKQAAYSSYLTAVSTLNTANSTALTLHSTMLSKWKTFYDLATSSTYENENNTPKTDARTAVEFNTAQDDWLAAEKKYIDQQTAVAQAQADVSSKWLLYQATQNAEIKATTNGVIANLSVAEGDSVTASKDVVLTLIPKTETQFIHVSINEVDIPKIKVGQKVKIEIDAIDDKTFEGDVARVDSIGTNTQGVITYSVYVKLLEKNTSIKSHMTANVEIETEIKENVLSVPNSAVKLYQGGRAIQVLENGKPKYIPIKIGIKGNERTEILEGIKEGQEIITGAKNVLIQRKGPFGF